MLVLHRVRVQLECKRYQISSDNGYCSSIRCSVLPPSPVFFSNVMLNLSFGPWIFHKVKYILLLQTRTLHGYKGGAQNTYLLFCSLLRKYQYDIILFTQVRVNYKRVVSGRLLTKMPRPFYQNSSTFLLYIAFQLF